MPTARLAEWDLVLPEDRSWDWTPLVVASAVQTVRPARARNAVQIGRGQALVGWSFSVARQHRDYAAAGLYLDDLPRLVVRTFGAFEADRGLGGPRIRLVGAKVTAFAAQPHKGIRTIVNYTVTGSLPPDIA